MEEEELFKQCAESNDCPYDWLMETEVPAGWTFDDAMTFYVRVMHEIDRDNFYRYTDDQIIDLYTNEDVTDYMSK